MVLIIVFIVNYKLLWLRIIKINYGLDQETTIIQYKLIFENTRNYNNKKIMFLIMVFIVNKNLLWFLSSIWFRLWFLYCSNF